MKKGKQKFMGKNHDDHMEELKTDENMDKESESLDLKDENLTIKDSLSPGDAQPEIKQLEKELNEKNNQLLRLAADFENYRNRENKEKENLINFAGETVIRSLLPVIDNFERAINSMKDTQDVKSVVTGIELIYKQFIDSLTKIGVSYIETVGKQFDPEFHEAVQRTSSDQQPDQTVIAEYQKGYLLNGRVIRHAMVNVVVND